MPESKRSVEGVGTKIRLMVFDKLVLSLGILLVALTIENSWHAKELELQKVATAGALLPHFGNDPNTKTYMLHILVGSNTLAPALVAPIAGDLIDEGVVGDQLMEAIEPSVMSDIRPFLDKAKKVMESYEANPDENWETFKAWQGLFKAILDKARKTDPAFGQLNSDNAFWERNRLYTLVSMIVGDVYDLPADLGLIQSQMEVVQRVGHMSVLARGWSDYYAESELYIVDRIGREPSSDADAVLLSEELRVLSQSSRLFDRPLDGDIAIPIGELFQKTRYPGLKDDARDVLISMSDCGISAEGTLSAYVTELREGLLGINDPLERLDVLLGMRNELYLLGDIGTAMNSSVLLDALNSLYDLNDVQSYVIGMLDGKPCRDR